MTAIIIVVIVLFFCIAGNLYCKYKIRYHTRKLDRNEKLHAFRLNLLLTHPDLYDRLPSYKVMLDENRPLTIESYFPELKTNLK